MFIYFNHTGSLRVRIEAWLDKDSHAHAFLMFNINPTIACHFQNKDEKTGKELWEAIKKRYDTANPQISRFTTPQTLQIKTYYLLISKKS